MLALTISLGAFFPPSKISEPPERAEVFAEPVLIAPTENGFRFLTFRESKGIAPLWAIGVEVHETAQTDWRVKDLMPGLIHRSSRWTYSLTSNRFDEGWQRDKSHPFSLPDETLRSLRPAVVAELNRRDSTKKGDRLEALLKEGLQESSYRCPQNIIVVLTWISIAMALASVAVMLLAPPSRSSPE